MGLGNLYPKPQFLTVLKCFKFGREPYKVDQPNSYSLTSHLEVAFLLQKERCRWANDERVSTCFTCTQLQIVPHGARLNCTGYARPCPRVSFRA